jgi:Ser/Thr protein kinase RdoA (MazF antagonist)
VVTSATVASEASLREAAAHFFSEPTLSGLSFSKCEGGVNNKVYTVSLPGSAAPSFCLRLYNNGNNTGRVLYEHEVLAALEALPASAALPFELPRAIKSLSAQPFVTLSSSGACACLFPLIPGGAAPLSAARAIGRATAQLVGLMAGLSIQAPAVNPLYRHIYTAHQCMSRELFAATVAAREFEPVRPSMDFLCAEVARAEAESIPEALAAGLPEQVINADLHFDNVLWEEGREGEGEGRVSGLLDFEFSCADWRVMEVRGGGGLSCARAETKTTTTASQAPFFLSLSL